MEAVAKDVSEKLNSVHFRKMLKHEVTLRFDGDANILLSSIVQRMPKYLAHEEAMNAVTRNPYDDVILSKYNWDIIAAAAEQYPQMQIAVQTDAENWDPQTFTPSVVYIRSDFDEATHTSCPGFTPAQARINVSTVEDNINYVVISQNERTTIRNGEVRLTVSNCLISEIVYRAPYNPEADAAMMLPEDCNGGGGGGGGTGGGGTGNPPYIQYIGTGQNGRLPTLISRQMGTVVGGSLNRLAPVGTFNGVTVYRKDFRHERMREIRCDNLGQIESRFHGAPEIRLHVFEQNVLNPSENLQIFKEQFEPKKRRSIDGKWWDCPDVTMHLWDYVGTGKKASFGYYEYDGVILPNEFLVSIGEIIVDILAITGVIPPGDIYGNIRASVATGIRSLKQANSASEYIGKDDYDIHNDLDEWPHSTGGTTFRTKPDL